MFAKTAADLEILAVANQQPVVAGGDYMQTGSAHDMPGFVIPWSAIEMDGSAKPDKVDHVLTALSIRPIHRNGPRFHPAPPLRGGAWYWTKWTGPMELKWYFIGTLGLNRRIRREIAPFLNLN